MNSTVVRGTGESKTTLNWWEYWVGHCWMTGWQSISSAYKIWGDLMMGNYEGYDLLDDDDPYTCCYEWFWGSLGEDNVYEKEFLEYLMQLSEDVRTGKEKVVPLDEGFFDRIKDLVDVED